jgi:uncharacterized DUF497 family protein
MGPVKAETNRKEHKISFEQARDVFKDAMAIDKPDDREEYGEERFNRTGMVEGRVLVVTYTMRTDEHSGSEVVRIISARLAERRERRRYHEA